MRSASAGGDVVHDVNHLVDDPVEQAPAAVEVAVVGEDGGLFESRAAQRDAGGVELGQVQVDDVVAAHRRVATQAEASA